MLFRFRHLYIYWRLKSFSVGGLAPSPLNPPPGLCHGPAGGLIRPPDLSPQVVPTFHFIPSYAPELYMNPSQLAPLPTLPLLLAPLFNQLAPLFETTRPLSKKNISNSPPLWSVVDWLGNYQVPYTRMSEGCRRWKCNRDSYLYFYSITGADLLQIGLSVYVWILVVIINDLRKLLPHCMFLM